MPPQCTALNVSDQSRCEVEAGSLNGLFCGYHSRQCHALYKGYKRRNARLDALAKSPPEFLAESTVPLANQTFKDVKSETVLRQLHSHLTLRYALLDRVIRARKMHHSRFFAMSLDYGHQHYLDNLSNERFIVLHALQRLERRTAEVLYRRQNWFNWVRQQQDNEESHRESEKKKIRLEAALFKRHWAQVKLHLKELKWKEDLKRQEEYLEEAFQERMSLEEECSWDPIDDIVRDDRSKYIDIIKIFLLLKDETVEDENVGLTKPSLAKEKKASQKKGAKVDEKKEPLEPNGLQTRLKIRKRLKEGDEYRHGPGPMLKGTIENPLDAGNRTVPLSDDEIDGVLDEITEIKHLFFSRLLLSHASLLPAAIRANNVEAFLADGEINDADLRDICLKLENPDLQAMRDACADLLRGEEDDVDEPSETDEGESNILSEKTKPPSKFPPWRRSNGLPQMWKPKGDHQLQKRRQRQQSIMDQSTGGSEGNFIDFSLMDDETEQRGKKMRVRVCGRSVYNYPSEKAMNRGGWLHFSIIAHESSLYDAVGLCRHWDEFYELNVLTVFRFFPNGSWLEWAGDQLKQRLLQLGFIPYHEYRDAGKVTVHHQSGSRGYARRSHAIFEARNYIAAYIKRNDQASRRLIQFLSMQTHRILLLVRDAKTGRIIISPPKDELWLVREKSGLGRAAKHDWNILSEVGPKLFEQFEATRRWSLGFNDYYDVFVWDLDPGDRFANMYGAIIDALFKAHRFRQLSDTYNVAGPILKVLTRDTESRRVREIKPSELTEESVKVESLWDVIHNSQTQFVFFNEKREVMEKLPKNLLYNDIDALEDQILFPEETPGTENSLLAEGKANVLSKLEREGPDMDRFVYDLDTDEEVPGSDVEDDDEHDLSDGTFGNEDEEWENAEGEDDLDMKDIKEDENPISDELKTFISHFMKYHDSIPQDEKEMFEQYGKFIKRESSKVFKESWHKADFEPGATQRYNDSLDLAKRMGRVLITHAALSYIIPLAFLDVNPNAHRRIIPDMREAYSMMALFFSDKAAMYDNDFDDKLGDHLIVNQVERAKKIPDRRRPQSNNNSPASLWKEVDALRKNPQLYEAFPEEWDRAIRPIIARLYREGILRNSYVPFLAGQAFSHQESNRAFDLYVDFRMMINEITLNPELQEPPPFPQLLATARTFASHNPTARFAFLRLWSAPHFYPLIIGLEKRDRMAFYDGQGRAWEWKFIPKDMPFSEWSVHQQSRLRMRPFAKMLADRVWFRQDTFLVMGTDEKDLLKLASATTYAIQTDPWRLEVDLWRSFVNVDLQFLEGLDQQWLI